MNGWPPPPVPSRRRPDWPATTGARLGWIPRRAGERGALEAGCLPNLLPGGRPVDDASAREQTAAAWNISESARRRRPRHRGDPGRRPRRRTRRAADRRCRGRRPARPRRRRWPPSRPHRSSSASNCGKARSPTSPTWCSRSHPSSRKSGSFVNWEGRIRPFEAALPTNAVPDLRVLHILADEIGVDLGLPGAAAAGDELARLGLWDGPRPEAPPTSPPKPPQPGPGEAVLAGWRMLLDAGRLQDGEPYLAGTARTPVVRLSAATAAEIGAADGRSGHRRHRQRCDHAAAGDHRHGRSRGVAAAELPGLARCTGSSR